MVCLGNICRSPLAQGILEHKVAERSLGWEVDSAGTGGWHTGELPDKRSQEVALAHGIDIRGQRARQIRSIDIDDFDLIYCMDSSNYNDVQRLCHTDAERAKVRLIMNESEPGMNINVPDPYYDKLDGFEKVYQMLDKACEAIIDKRV
jgi:protein-tyrosine phosphatase